MPLFKAFKGAILTLKPPQPGECRLNQPGRLEMSPQPGFGTDPQSRAVRITAIGHASARWRGASSKEEASRLNERLSIQRADNIRARVEQILRAEVPNIRISDSTSTLSDDDLDGVQLGAYGVGSREPVLQPPDEKVDPRENNPINRSVQVLIDFATTHYGQAGRSLAPLSRPAFTRDWYVKVMRLEGVAGGGAVYGLDLFLRNSLSGKTAVYSGVITGGGLSSDVFSAAKDLFFDNLQDNAKVTGANHNTKHLKLIGEEVSFHTENEMGFSDFDGLMVTIEKLGVNVLVKAKGGYLSFWGLGPDARKLSFDTGFGLSWSVLTNVVRGKPLKGAGEGWVASGKIYLSGRDPGDNYQIDLTDSVPYTTQDKRKDGLIVTFPTGKAQVSDLSDRERTDLENFVKRWAQRI